MGLTQAGGGGGKESSLFIHLSIYPFIHKELERKVKLGVMNPKIKNKSELQAHEYTILGQSTWGVTVVID